MYGVILLSLIAIRRAFDPKPPKFTEVVDWAREVYDPKQSLVHESLQKESAYVAEDGRAIIALAMHCVENKMTKRPTMKEIIQKLRCFKSILAQTSSVQSRLEKGVHGPSISMSVELSSASAAVDGRNITLGGKCMVPNVQDTIFEISRKYVRLTHPIRRRDLGSDWCAAVNLKSPKREEVVIRKIGNAFDNIIDAKRTLWEIKLLRHMNHDNVIAIKDIILRPPQKETFNDVYIVYDLMDITLHQKIRSNYPVGDIHCRIFLCQLLRGLEHVHSANVLHCDLKPTNLVLKQTVGLMIGDFGLARTTCETNSMTENVGTRWYWAPELLLKCSEYTAAIDIWSVGCIPGEMMTTLPLFPGENSVHQLTLITELIGSPDKSSLGFLQSDDARMIVSQLPQYPKQQFSDRFVFKARSGVDLLEKMLVFDPNKRITVDEALCHPYLQPLLDEKVHVCPTPFNFNFNFEQPRPLTKEDIKELIWEESVKFNPDPEG